MAFHHKITDEPDHQHDTVTEARHCEAEHWRMAAEAAAEQEAERRAEQYLERGTPDTWRDEELERMSEAYGLPIPPGMR